MASARTHARLPVLHLSLSQKSLLVEALGVPGFRGISNLRNELMICRLGSFPILISGFFDFFLILLQVDELLQFLLHAAGHRTLAAGFVPTREIIRALD